MIDDPLAAPGPVTAILASSGNADTFPPQQERPIRAVLASPHPTHGWLGIAGTWPHGLPGILEQLRTHPGTPHGIPPLARHATVAGLTPRHLRQTDARWLLLVDDDAVHVDAIRHGTHGARTCVRMGTFRRDRPRGRAA